MTWRTIWSVATPLTRTLQSSRTPRRGFHGALIVEVYGPEKTENINLIREVRLQNDAGRWEFFLEGTPFPFDTTESYSSRRKTDRFTFDMMKQYLGMLGIRPFERDYILPSSSESAVLVELTGNLPPSARDVSLDEARRLNGIES